MTEIGESAAEYTVVIPEGQGELRLVWAATTDRGHRRAANEDSYIARYPVFAVADGMGGHEAGDLASAAVVGRLAEVVSGDFASAEAVLDALEMATEDIVAIAGGSTLGVGTTVTGAGLVLQTGELYFVVFNVGDSRVYLFEDAVLDQVTVDHSVVQELVDAGALSRAEAEQHPDSNIITRAIGFGANPEPDYWMIPVRAGQRLLLCSDGLTKEVSDEQMLAVFSVGLSAVETAAALKVAALDAGGRDNVTTIIVDVIDAPEPRDVEDTAPRSSS